MNGSEISAIIFNGQLPEGLNKKTEFILESQRQECMSGSTIALLLTAARNFDFNNDKEWSRWCEEKFGYTDSYRCHLGQVGRLLLDTRDNIELFQELFQLDHYKLLSLERLDRLDLSDFLNSNDVASMNRDQVRDAVNNWLGMETPAAGGNKGGCNARQPDLFDLVGSICVLRPETVINSITDKDKAWTICRGGLLMYGSSIEYYKTHPEALPAELIEALEDDLKTLRSLEAAKKAGLKVSQAV